MAGKKRADVGTALGRARSLAGDVARLPEEERGAALMAGLRSLWPAPLYACVLRAGGATRATAADEAGRARPDWAEALRDGLTGRAVGEPVITSGPLPPGVDLPDHALHVATATWSRERYGALAFALHKRATEASLAQAVLARAADHLALALAERDAARTAAASRLDVVDFAALVTHEFNNALNGINLQVAILERKGVTPEEYPELGAIKQEVRRAGARARQMQDYCARGRAERGACDLNAAAGAGAARCGARSYLAPGLPPVVGTGLDLERLTEVLAREAAASGATDVLVATGRGEGGAVWLRVEDNGAEADEDMLSRLFEPFVAARPGATGHGLALARAIARRLDGHLTAEKRPGGGLVVVATLNPASPVLS